MVADDWNGPRVAFKGLGFEEILGRPRSKVKNNSREHSYGLLGDVLWHLLPDLNEAVGAHQLT